MSMKETLAAINRMEAEGIIARYAIGGAVGALFYLEPSDTADIDVFVAFREASGALISLAPIYAYLKERGYTDHRKEGILIGDWPVQFLPASDGLDAEALAAAVDTEVEGVPTRVMTAEHLVALALRTARGKDFLRILAFLEGGQLKDDKLQDILRRHGLVEKWRNFRDKYLQDDAL
jgi:hypothetical protein